MPDAPMLGATKKVTLEESAFTAGFHEALVHQSVRAEQAARRRGTAATKTRAMVRGGSAKPWRQKGTGRARAGSSRSPIWTGGGVVFGPQPRSFTFKVNRKEKRVALRSALSLHAQRGSIAVLDAAAFKAPKTSQAADLLADWGQAGPTLVVLAAEESAAALSFRNIDRVAVLAHQSVGVVDLLRAASLVVSQAALDALTARAGGKVQEPKAAATPKAAAAEAPAEKSAPKAAAEKSAKAEVEGEVRTAKVEAEAPTAKVEGEVRTAKVEAEAPTAKVEGEARTAKVEAEAPIVKAAAEEPDTDKDDAEEEKS
jgi:large subunit ribosomal protein L4